jgi:hypothetical protein
MRKVLFLLFISIAQISVSQIDTTKKLQISLITCSPGDELYSIFGHTAIRIIDSTNYSDIIYNYGTFDFDDPNFLLKFTRGKLDYFLSTDEANHFFAAYQNENRSITEQILQLTNFEKNNIQQALIKNLAGNNKFYKYDFLFDNCTTRIRDLLKKNTSISYSKKLVKDGTTFRNMLYTYLDAGGMCWSKLGIDILLGSKIDKNVTIEQSSFLPDYLMLAIDSFNLQKNFVANKKSYLIPVVATSQREYIPLMVFSVLFLVMIFLSISKNKILQKIFYFLSIFLIFITGIFGCVLIFMWFGTDHKSCGNNYNLLWALPTNLFALFLINGNQINSNKYFKTVFLISFILLIFWFFLPQQFNISLIPLVLTMMLCYRKFAFNKTMSNNF